MLAKQDAYAKGMVEWNEEYFNLTPELDLFQYRMIKPHLGNDILEVGAGPGRITQLLLRDGGPYSRFVVSEPSDHFFEQLKMRFPPAARCTLVQGATSDLLRRYPLAFDTIFSVDVLEHVEDDRQFVTDCLGMLKPGGKLITLVPALQILYSDFDRSIGHYRRYNKTMVKDLIRGLDYQIQQLYYTNFLAIIPSLIFFKMRKLDYQNTSNAKQFMFLARLYSKYFIPAINLMERYISMQLGLNLTFVLKKNEVGQAINCPHT